jgi:hypothetical protein
MEIQDVDPEIHSCWTHDTVSLASKACAAKPIASLQAGKNTGHGL